MKSILPLFITLYHRYFVTLHKRLFRPQIIVFILGILMLITYLSFYFLPLLEPPNSLNHVGISILLFLLYLFLLPFVARLKINKIFYVFIGLGLLYRLILLPIEPSMSDDYYRYVWDGRVQAHHFNPYINPPNSLILQKLQDPFIFPFINYAHYKTVYPPVAQIFFLVAHFISDSDAKGIKWLLFLCEIVTFVLISIWLRRAKQLQSLLLLYAWAPLPILELMLDAHLDGFAIPFLLATLLSTQTKRAYMTGVFLAFTILVKPLPLFLFPLILWHFRGSRPIRVLLSFTLTCLILYIPYFDAGTSLFSQLVRYSRHWYFNGFLFNILMSWFSNDSIRLGLAGLILSIALGTPFMKGTLEIKFLIPLTAYLLLTPTLYPWYLIWITPWIVFTRKAWLIWFIGSIEVAHSVHYFYITTGKWGLPPSLLAVEFIPIFFLLFLALKRSAQELYK